jgi:hypothetical protein
MEYFIFSKEAHMKILLAVRESEKDKFISVLQKSELRFHVLDQLPDFANSVGDFQFALIDEDFAGLQTGWILAQNIRNTGHSIKIVMIVRKNPEPDLISLYDVTFGFPVSEEEIIGEIKRQ